MLHKRWLGLSLQSFALRPLSSPHHSAQPFSYPFYLVFVSKASLGPLLQAHTPDLSPLDQPVLEDSRLLTGSWFPFLGKSDSSHRSAYFIKKQTATIFPWKISHYLKYLQSGSLSLSTSYISKLSFCEVNWHCRQHTNRKPRTWRYEWGSVFQAEP